MRPLVSAAVSLALAACGTPAPAPAKPLAPISKCPQVADRMLAFYTQMKPEAPPPEMAKLFRDVVVERCTQDAWRPDAQDCLLQDGSDMDRCAQFLTEQQTVAFQKEAEEKLVAAARAHGATVPEN